MSMACGWIVHEGLDTKWGAGLLLRLPNYQKADSFSTSRLPACLRICRVGYLRVASSFILNSWIWAASAQGARWFLGGGGICAPGIAMVNRCGTKGGAKCSMLSATHGTHPDRSGPDPAGDPSVVSCALLAGYGGRSGSGDPCLLGVPGTGGCERRPDAALAGAAGSRGLV